MINLKSKGTLDHLLLELIFIYVSHLVAVRVVLGVCKNVHFCYPVVIVNCDQFYMKRESKSLFMQKLRWRVQILFSLTSSLKTWLILLGLSIDESLLRSLWNPFIGLIVIFFVCFSLNLTWVPGFDLDLEYRCGVFFIFELPIQSIVD